MELLEAIGKMMDEKLEPIKQDVSGLKQDVSGLKQDVSGLKQDVSGLNKRVDRLEGEFACLKESVDWMRGAMFRIEENYSKKIDVAVSGVDDHNSTLKHHNRRIAALESDVERHDMQIAALLKV